MSIYYPGSSKHACYYNETGKKINKKTIKTIKTLICISVIFESIYFLALARDPAALKEKLKGDLTGSKEENIKKIAETLRSRILETAYTLVFLFSSRKYDASTLVRKNNRIVRESANTIMHVFIRQRSYLTKDLIKVIPSIALNPLKDLKKILLIKNDFARIIVEVAKMINIMFQLAVGYKEEFLTQKISHVPKTIKTFVANVVDF